MVSRIQWAVRELGELVTFTNGGAWNQSEYSTSGVPVVRVTNVKNGTVDMTACAFLSDISARKYGKHRLHSGDLIVCTVGSHPTQPGSVVGRTAVVPRHANGSLLNQNAVCVRSCSGELDREWLGCFAKSLGFRAYIEGCAQGAANQVRMAVGLLRKMPVPLPPLPIQKKIAAILSAYDDLIENNQRRIRILEEMAQNLYREWFVKFRFPGHEKVKMVDSPLGKIPQGWEPMRLDQLIDFNPSLRLATDISIPYVGMESLSTSSMTFNITEFRNKTGGSRFQNRDTLLARITPCLENGKTGFVQCLPSDDVVALGSTEFIVMRSRLLSPEYVYLLARSDYLRGLAIKSMSGATGRQRVQIQSLTQYEVPLPNAETLKTFTSTVVPMFQQVWTLARRNANLRQTRNLLLPKLISGEVDVSDLDIKVPEQDVA